MSDIRFTCPRCGETLNSAVRMKHNKRVIYCSNIDTHDYLEGEGDTEQEALDDLLSKSASKQPMLKALAVVLLLLLPLPVSAWGDVPNLRLVDSRAIYRSAQPETAADWRYVKSLGVSNVIKLNSGRDCVPSGMTVHYFPINACEQLFSSSAVTRTINAALPHVTPGTLIHCTHGNDRTGLLVAIYRVRHDHWTKANAEKEMLSLGFHKSLFALWASWKKEKEQAQLKALPPMPKGNTKDLVITNPPPAITFEWNASASTNVDYYKLYQGPSSGTYTNAINVGNVTIFTFTNLVRGWTQFYVVTANTLSGLESLPSNEISYSTPEVPLPPTLLRITAQTAKSVTGPWSDFTNMPPVIVTNSEPTQVFRLKITAP